MTAATSHRSQCIVISSKKNPRVCWNLEETTMVFLTRKKQRAPSPSSPQEEHLNHNEEEQSNTISTLISVLADAGCTVCTVAGGPPSVPVDSHKFIRRLESRFTTESDLVSTFLDALEDFIRNPNNLRRILIPLSNDININGHSRLTRRESLVRLLLLVPPLQLHLQILLLEKLPEHFNGDISKLIINQFVWLDFLIDPSTFSEKLLEVLEICPLSLKKDIIGFLPEMIGDQVNCKVVESLERMLQDDLDVIVPVLDSLSNLNLDEQLQDQTITIALSCLRTVDEDHMAHLLRFLLLSSTPKNVKRIISQIRRQVKFISIPEAHVARNRKLKGKSFGKSAEASILESICSNIRFKSMICEEILKELRSLEQSNDHKVIDVWLLILIHTNGGSLQKSVEKTLKRKILEGCLRMSLFDQCIHGQRDLVKGYFATYLSVCEYLLTCKENVVREFGSQVYISLFEEFAEIYSRLEILGALVAHIGTGIEFEVSSALEIMVSLTSKYSIEMIPISSHINGILDYLEGFTNENLHRVYEIFCQLAWFAHSDNDSCCSSFANELLMIVRKQVGNPDLRFKMMGIVGILKIVSKLGNENAIIKSSHSEKSNSEEALELLKTSTESCKLEALPLILLYDELINLLGSTILSPIILEWLGRHAGDFESNFLSDLNDGQLPSKDLLSLQGELWMNLDGDISPLCVDILRLVSSNECSINLQILPAQFLLLSSVERCTNQGSLGGIDALLGCPIHLPSPMYFDTNSSWSSLTSVQKKTVCLSFYYAINWIRESLNAFSTQVSGNLICVTQSTKEEMIAKLLKRLRNLIFMESLLNFFLKEYTISLPEVHNCFGYPRSLLTSKPINFQNVRKKRRFHTLSEGASDNKKTSIKKSKGVNDGLRQPTILEILKGTTASVNQGALPGEGSGSSSCKGKSQSAIEQNAFDSFDISVFPTFLDGQKLKFRPLLVDCLALLSFSQAHGSCCSDSAAELPLYLYLLRDFHHKLDSLSSSGNTLMISNALRYPPGPNRMTIFNFFELVSPLFPCLRKHLDVAVCVLNEGSENCQDHWRSQSNNAGNPDVFYIDCSKLSTAEFVCREVFICFKKLSTFPELFQHAGMPILQNLLEQFQPIGEFVKNCLDINPLPSPGSMEYLYCGAYIYLENIMDTVCDFSCSLASEILFTLDSIIKSISTLLKKFVDENAKSSCIKISNGVLSYLQKMLGVSAQNLLLRDWNNVDNKLKSKGDMIQKIVYIYLNNNKSPSDLLVDLACSLLPQVSCLSSKNKHDTVRGFPTLSPTLFVYWYRVLHDVNVTILSKLIKEDMSKSRGKVQHIAENEVFVRLGQFVDVIVSLIGMCKTHDKVIIHAMAIKYGGKFIDTFLKAFNFLEAHFKKYSNLIIQMITELQKATRILQTLCSEAKVSKRTTVTCKVPAVKRSLERFLFCVKALLLNAPNGCTFWMGSLKHKDLLGHVVPSQAYGEVDANTDADINDNAQDDDDNDTVGDDNDTVGDADVDVDVDVDNVNLEETDQMDS